MTGRKMVTWGGGWGARGRGAVSERVVWRKGRGSERERGQSRRGQGERVGRGQGGRVQGAGDWGQGGRE